MVLSEGEIRRFADDGWIVVPDLVGGEILDALADKVGEFHRSLQRSGHVGRHFYWSRSAEHPRSLRPA